MFDITGFVEVKRLIEAVERVAGALAPHERELHRSLAEKYAEPIAVEATDLRCLEVLLRNVEVRKAFRADPDKTAERVIELKRTRGSKKC